MAGIQIERVTNRGLPDITIASGATTSSSFTLEGWSKAWLIMPSAFSGASITFQGSQDGSTFVDVYDRDGNKVTVPVAASRCIALPDEVVGLPYVRIVSASAEAASRTIGVIVES